MDGSTLGNRIREAVTGSGKSLGEVCREIGVDRPYLTRAIKGRFKPGADKLAALARATGKSADFFLGLPGAGERGEKPQPRGYGEGLDPAERRLIDGVRKLDEENRPDLLDALLVLASEARRSETRAALVENLARSFRERAAVGTGSAHPRKDRQKKGARAASGKG